MRGRVIKSLYKKEMLDVLRDKKTVVMMIVVPIILYPLLMLAGVFAMTSISSSMASRTYRVAFSENVDSGLVDYFKNCKDDDYAFEVVETEKISDDVLENALLSENIDLYIVENSTQEMIDKELIKKDDKNSSLYEGYTIYYLSSVTNSSYGTSQAEVAISDYSRKKSEEMLEDAGLDSNLILNPVCLTVADKATKEESAGSLMGSVIPFMLIVSLIMGTMYPAIDTTAGERERGTLETMLTLPITNQELIFSKFLTVATIGIVSAVLNLISMGGVCVYMYKLAYSASDTADKMNFSRFVPAIIVGALCIFAFAVFISAITMCVCAFARTYKEANNYITPLMLVVLFASFVGIVPNVTLTPRLALVPVANICLLIKDILSFKYNFGIIAIVLISNVAYGVISVLLLGKIYKSEGILFGESLAGIRIFERRVNMKKGQPVSMGDMLLVMAVTVILMIYAGGMATVKSVNVGLIVTQLSIALVPILAAWYTRCDMVDAFKLRLPKIKDVIAAVFLVIGAMIIGIILTAITSSIFESSAENATSTTEELLEGGFVVSTLMVALVPAVAEELMFRGYILGSLQSRHKMPVAIVIGACIFGAYHMSIVRFFTTALLGLAICFVAAKTKSIVPGIIMHFINNFTACLQTYYPEELGKAIPFLAKDSISIGELMIVILIGIVSAFVGIYLLILDKKSINSKV